MNKVINVDETSAEFLKDLERRINVAQNPKNRIPLETAKTNMEEWLGARFPVDGSGADAWTVAEPQAESGQSIGASDFGIATTAGYQNALTAFIESLLEQKNLPESLMKQAGDLRGQLYGNKAGTWLTAIDEDVQTTLPSGENSPLAVTLWYGNGPDGGPEQLGLRGMTMSFRSASAKKRLEENHYAPIGGLLPFRVVSPSYNDALYPGVSAPVVAFDKYDVDGYNTSFELEVIDEIYSDDNTSQKAARLQKIKENANCAIMGEAGIRVMFDYFNGLEITEASFAVLH
jgi:hypothetical protein